MLKIVKCNYVFSHGKLVGYGNHEMLMKENEEYRILVNTQKKLKIMGVIQVKKRSNLKVVISLIALVNR